MTRLLFVEDNKHKRERVVAFLAEVAPQIVLIEAQSFTTGGRAAEQGQFDFILMDMSLPTRDKTRTESGGTFRTFGGRELARKILRRGIRTKFIFLTQYDAFSDSESSHTLDSLREELRTECGNSFLALVRYDSSKTAWKEEIERLLRT